MYITEIKYTTRVSHMIKSSLSILCSLSLFGYTAVTIVMVCPHPFLSEGCLSCQVLSNGHLSPRQPQSSALHAWSMRLSAVLFLRLRFMFYMHVCISEFTTICQQIEKNILVSLSVLTTLLQPLQLQVQLQVMITVNRPVPASSSTTTLL